MGRMYSFSFERGRRDHVLTPWISATRGGNRKRSEKREKRHRVFLRERKNRTVSRQAKG